MTNNIVSTTDIWKWVGLGWVGVQHVVGWVGFQKVDPCPCLTSYWRSIVLYCSISFRFLDIHCRKKSWP